MKPPAKGLLAAPGQGLTSRFSSRGVEVVVLKDVDAEPRWHKHWWQAPSHQLCSDQRLMEELANSPNCHRSPHSWYAAPALREANTEATGCSGRCDKSLP
mmetsp:Transcript_57458/g.171422  ORF Transcript_57458/g.171422 Transcript_57458/m.171422 type:complete len:100 (-) Transcript_57458:682-981(-)